MPRKTKKQKKRADNRKTINITYVDTVTTENNIELSSNITPQVRTVTKKDYTPTYKESPLDVQTRKDTIRDIYKTCLIIGLLLGMQMSLFIFKPFINQFF